MEASLHENSRNGMSPKTVATEIGDVELAIPRDRNGTFTPMLVPKGQRRLDGLDGMIISLHAGGMTLRDIQHHLASTIGTEISHETISKIVDQIGEEILIWQQRPLEALYPVIFLDAIVVKVRDGGHVRNKAAHLAISIDMEGIKHVLGIWVQENQGTTFWAAVSPNSPTAACRGRTDHLLRRPHRLPRSSRRQAWPEATVQTCVVHLIRAAMRFVSHPRPQGRHRRAEADPSGRERRDSACRARRLRGDRAGQALPRPARHSVTRGERFTPFLAFPPELRRVIYTTNSIESLNYQLRKITQEPRPLPQRSRGRQAALAGDLRHRRQIERATGRKSEVSAPSNTKHPDTSSRARPRRTGNRHCNSSHWPTPTASTPTSDHHDRERLHKELDRLASSPAPMGLLNVCRIQ